MDHLWQTCEFSGLDILQLYAALRLRQEVFAVEQNCAYLDLDNLDQGAVHMLCWHRDELVAYQRCLAPGTAWPESALGRIVVRAQSRGRQLGRELVERGIRHNLGRWPEQDIRINAQAYLVPPEKAVDLLSRDVWTLEWFEQHGLDDFWERVFAV